MSTTRPELEFRHVGTNGIRLHVVQAGPSDGPLVILLHGFPEFWYGWRRQIPCLAAAGYRVWAPDQRGYNLSDKPRGIASYFLNQLSADVIGLIDAAGRDRAHLVAHDWGAGVAWWTATHYPQRLQRMIILNGPHGKVMQQHLRRNLAQLRKSWYMLFFQLPWLPETLARLGNWRVAARSLQGTSRPGTFSDADLEKYRAAWSQPGAFTAMINWYRTLLRKTPGPRVSSRVRVPTLLIWGVQDPFLGHEMARPSIQLCDDGQLVFIQEATHWVQHEEPERVNRLIDEYLQG